MGATVLDIYCTPIVCGFKTPEEKIKAVKSIHNFRMGWYILNS